MKRGLWSHLNTLRIATGLEREGEMAEKTERGEEKKEERKRERDRRGERERERDRETE